MKLYETDKTTIRPVRTLSFKNEKEIQGLVEGNLLELFNLEFIRSEMTVKNFRVDTLCFDPDNQSFVIIEYKKDRTFSVIDQGYTYLSLLLNNKSDFVLEYNEKKKRSLRRDDVDWSQSRILFISPEFTEYQKHSINFKDVPFGLWEVQKYDKGLVSFSEHKTSSDVSISTTSEDMSGVVKKVSKEIVVYTEDYHLNKRSGPPPSWVLESYSVLRERILSLGNIDIVPRKLYISFQQERPVVDVEIQQRGMKLTINMKKGTLKDPTNLTSDISQRGHWGNGDYWVVVDKDTDLDDLMFLITQSYKDKVSSK